MDNRPLLYDAFCGAGGASKGYMDAGFRVIGIDNKSQPRYCGDGFILMDALEFLERLAGGEYEQPDAIHASPPCQGYSIMNNLPWNSHREYPYLILPTRDALEALELPYVIENVEGAKWGAKGIARRGLEAHGMKAAWLCGLMFGLPFYRHRLFESNWFWMQPGHASHKGVIRNGRTLAGRAREFVFPRNGLGTSINQHSKGWRRNAEAMGVDWMMKREEVGESIPPAYTLYVGTALMAELGA